MPEENPLDAVRNAAREVVARVAHTVQDMAAPPIPGAPASREPSLEERVVPEDGSQGSLPKSDQRSPSPHSPTGAPVGERSDQAQQGPWLTTADGVRLRDTDHSLKAGERGPTLLQDHHLREKVSHFDHERIPERVVHARGSGAHGVFVGYGTADEVCSSAFLGEGVETPVFVRFSTVLGNRGSADTVRDTRGFATKFYTEAGTFDLVGNNIPVFFIQDGIKFPDVVHAAKPSQDREIPQAQSAHDSFWDFVSLHTEAQAHTMWNMSDRGIPRSLRTMEGFGVHTFRTTNDSGQTSLVKFHWKPALGVHSLVWEEAQMLCGFDPDFHRRDLADAIETGAYPQWELGVQVFEDTPDQTFEGIDLLDPTKLVPEELAPVQPLGLMTLTHNPGNFFEETEQVAFNVGHLVPGIDVTDDPLMQARLFSYTDTQITRLGGPNWHQNPVNRPHAAVNDMLREGWRQDASHTGAAPYRPNSLDGGCPFQAGAADGAFVEAPVRVTESTKVRASPASYDDHFSQATMFWQSMSPVEQDHIVLAYTFELGKVYEQVVKERQLRALAAIDADLCRRVAAGLGLPAPDPVVTVAAAPAPSPALSQLGGEWPTDGRVVGVLVGPDADLGAVDEVRRSVLGAGMVPLVVAPTGGPVGEDLVAQRTYGTARSVELDAVLVAGQAHSAPDLGAAAAAGPDPRMLVLLQEAHRHGKAVGAWDGGVQLVEAALGAGSAPGVVVGDVAGDVLEQVRVLLHGHRVWEQAGA